MAKSTPTSINGRNQTMCQHYILTLFVDESLSTKFFQPMLKIQSTQYLLKNHKLTNFNQWKDFSTYDKKTNMAACEDFTQM